MLAAALALTAVSACGRGGPPRAPAAVDPGQVDSPAVPAHAFRAVVDRVVDGDTLIARVGGGGQRLRVRVIGVDTPETVKPDTPVRCYGPEASAFTKRLLPPGTSVTASYEPGGETDRYGRQLWDVWLPDGRLLQAVLAAAGSARPYPYPPQLEHADLIRALGGEAQAEHRGLWGPPCKGASFGRSPP
jgi:micrococcal nuclease